MNVGIAIYNRPDLLQKCVDSFRHPVELLLIVNNGNIPNLAVRTEPETSVVMIGHGNNLGVAGAWNAIQHRVFDECGRDSVLICGNDIEFEQDDLAIFDKTVQEFPEADYVFGNHSFSNFLVKRSGWQKVGALDETFFPAYGEDGDLWQRIIRTPAKAIHAAGLRATHAGSATINSDIGFKSRVQAAQATSQKYYGQKWGCAPFSHASETFTTPFNRGGNVNEWKLSERRMKEPHFYDQWPRP